MALPSRTNSPGASPSRATGCIMPIYANFNKSQRQVAWKLHNIALTLFRNLSGKCLVSPSFHRLQASPSQTCCARACSPPWPRARWRPPRCSPPFLVRCGAFIVFCSCISSVCTTQTTVPNACVNVSFLSSSDHRRRRRTQRADCELVRRGGDAAGHGAAEPERSSTEEGEAKAIPRHRDLGLKCSVLRCCRPTTASARARTTAAARNGSAPRRHRRPEHVQGDRLDAAFYPRRTAPHEQFNSMRGIDPRPFCSCCAAQTFEPR